MDDLRVYLATKEHQSPGRGREERKCTEKLILCEEDPVQINMQMSLFMPQHSRWGQTKTEKMRMHGPPSATCRSAKDQERPSGSEDAENTSE